MGRDTHFGKYDTNYDFLRKNNTSIKILIPSIPGGFFYNSVRPGPGLEITRHFWRLTEIAGDLAGLSASSRDDFHSRSGQGQGLPGPGPVSRTRPRTRSGPGVVAGLRHFWPNFFSGYTLG